MATAEQKALVLEIERDFPAPRELVWQMWADTEHMARWHGPDGLWIVEASSDFRVGGTWRRCMTNGPEYRHWISGTYLEIDEPSRLSFSYVNDYDGFETIVTMDFESVGPRATRMRFRQTPFINQAERDGHAGGWSRGFELLSRYLSQFIHPDWRPIGLVRSDGVAEDIVAARRRMEDERREAQ